MDDQQFRVYIAASYQQLAAGVVTRQIKEEATELMEGLQDDASDWEGRYERELPELDGVDGGVIARVTEDGLQFGHYCQDGWNPSFFASGEQGGAVFDEMVVHYAIDDYGELDVETVSDAIHDDDVEEWLATVNRER